VTPRNWAFTAVSNEQRKSIFSAANVSPVFWGNDKSDEVVTGRPAGGKSQMSVIIVGCQWHPQHSEDLLPIEFNAPGFDGHVRYLNDPTIRLVVVPSDVPVDPKGRSERQSRAILLTPVTVVEDAAAALVVIPVDIIAFPFLHQMGAEERNAARRNPPLGGPVDVVQPPQTATRGSGVYVRPLVESQPQ
jgi:hypothetical protein